MLVYRVSGDISDIEQHLSGMAREQIPFATALALTRTAQFVQRKIREEIPRVFDRPTPFTLNSTYVQPATKQRLYSMVLIREQVNGRVAPIRYLQPQIYGGTRGRKSFEQRLIAAGRMPPNTYVVPGRAAPLDRYGNISGGQIQRILSDLQAQFDPTQNTPARGARGRRRNRGSFYFSTWPPRPRVQHLKPGIYLRTPEGLKPIMMFVRRANYRRRLRYFEIADQTARMRFPIEFSLALRRAIETSRRR